MTSVRWNSNARRGRIGSRIAEKKKNIDRTSYPPYSLPHTHLLTHILHTVLCTRALIQQQAETGQEKPCLPPPAPNTLFFGQHYEGGEKSSIFCCVCECIMWGTVFHSVVRYDRPVFPLYYVYECRPAMRKCILLCNAWKLDLAMTLCCVCTNSGDTVGNIFRCAMCVN